MSYKCDGNICGWLGDDAPNPLTERGQIQAETLGKEWVDVRIDHLLSSPSQRAHNTAKALSEHNKCHPEVIIGHHLGERRYGAAVTRLMQRGDQEAGSTALRGSLSGAVNRTYTPAEGGESLEHVAQRAEIAILQTLFQYGVNLPEPPELLIKKEATTTPADLPDGIPHVVIVSHNIFLSELYEKLHYWQEEYRETNCNYRNASW